MKPTTGEPRSLAALLFVAAAVAVPAARLSAQPIDYVAEAQKAVSAVGGSEADRPKQFVVSAFSLQGDGTARSLDAEAKALALLGFNAVAVKLWFDADGNVDAPGIDALLGGLSLRRMTNVGALQSLASYESGCNLNAEGESLRCPSVDSDLLLLDALIAPEVFECWACSLVNHTVASNGATPPGDFALSVISDETAWSHPRGSSAVCDSACVLDFQKYLVSHGVISQHDLDQLPEANKPIPLAPGQKAAASDLGTRRLFYWSMRYFADSVTGSFGRVRSAIADQLCKRDADPTAAPTCDPNYPVFANLNTNGVVYGPYAPVGRASATPIAAAETSDGLGRRCRCRASGDPSVPYCADPKLCYSISGAAEAICYDPSGSNTCEPLPVPVSQPLEGALSAKGYLEPLEVGRRNALTLWTYDWQPDYMAQVWSLYGDVMRSGAAHGALGFGGYVIGVCLGDEPGGDCTPTVRIRQPTSGASYKTLSLIGKGAKAVTVYDWGVTREAENWRNRTGAYEPLAKALHQIGWGERLLYPGRPARGSVAILMNGPSRLWDPNPPVDGSLPHYVQEIQGLHYALRHAGYVVDFVDDADIADDSVLTAHPYDALYVTQPNVRCGAQQRISSWVQNAGGTLIATPGALTADEFDTRAADEATCRHASTSPVSEIDWLLGLDAREPVRATIGETKGEKCGGGPLLQLIPGYCNYPRTLAASEPLPAAPAPHACSPPPDPSQRRIDATDTLHFASASLQGFPENVSLPLYGPVVSLTPAIPGPTVVATLEPRGQPSAPAGITLQEHCGTGGRCGRAIAYAFYPGFQYWMTPGVWNGKDAEHADVYYGPICHWDPQVRSLVTGPAQLAGAARPAVAAHVGKPGPAPEIEVDRLDSENGTALIALNWSFADTGPLQITVKDLAFNFQVTSHAQRPAPVQASAVGKDLVIDLPGGIDDVDVLLIDNLCKNEVTDGSETDRNCGGGLCPGCGTGATCRADRDCASNRCDLFFSGRGSDPYGRDSSISGRCVGNFPGWHVWYYDFLWKLRGEWNRLHIFGSRASARPTHLA